MGHRAQLGIDDLRHRLADTWSEYDWRRAIYRHGAFHDVFIVDAVLARVTRSRFGAERVSVRMDALRTIGSMPLAARLPTLIGEPERWDETRVAMLLTAVAGDADDGMLDDPRRVQRIARLLRDLRGAPATGLPPVRDWCGGEAWPEVVRDLLPLLSPEARSPAQAAVDAVLDLDEPLCPSHGDLTRFNLLWSDDDLPGVIDWDHIAGAGRSVDVACLLDSLSPTAVHQVADAPTLAAAAIHKRSFPLQVAAAGVLHGDLALRDAGLTSFVRRMQTT